MLMNPLLRLLLAQLVSAVHKERRTGLAPEALAMLTGYDRATEFYWQP